MREKEKVSITSHSMFAKIAKERASACKGGVV